MKKEMATREYVQKSHQSLAKVINDLVNDLKRTLPPETFRKMQIHVDTYPDRQAELKKNFDRLEDIIKKHIQDEENSLKKLSMAIYGDKDTGTIGMLQTVNETRDFLAQTKGIKTFLGIVVIFGAFVATITALFK